MYIDYFTNLYTMWAVIFDKRFFNIELSNKIKFYFYNRNVKNLIKTLTFLISQNVCSNFYNLVSF